MKSIRLVIPVMIVLAGTTVAFGQWGGRWGGGWGGGWGQRHSSTAAEGAMRGMGDLVRSAGAANLMNSEAASRYEDARSKYLDNRLKGTQTYFEMRRLNKEYRAAENPRPTAEQLFRINESKKPPTLSPSELDPLSGEIEWPAVLQLAAFDDQRAELEKLYVERARHQEFVSPEDYFSVKQISEDMDATLKTMVKKVPANDYIRGKTFLKSLVHEARPKST